ADGRGAGGGGGSLAGGGGVVTQVIVLQVAATFLLALDGLEERLEVALAEAERPVPLDELEKESRPVLHGPGEDLQQVAVLVPVDQDPAPLQLLDRRPHVADPGPQL